MRLKGFGWFYFGKMWKNMEKLLFFRADMAGLGKYCTGGYGRIGVYRVIHGVDWQAIQIYQQKQFIEDFELANSDPKGED